MNTRIKTGLLAALTVSIAIISPQTFAHGFYGGGGSGGGHVAAGQMPAHNAVYVSHGPGHVAGNNVHIHYNYVSAGHYPHGYGYVGYRPWPAPHYSPYHWHGGYWHAAYWHGGYWHGTYWPQVYVGVAVPLFVWTLPIGCATYWYSGVPYYYTNNAYYVWDAGQNGYVVTNPPPAAANESDSGNGSMSNSAATTRLFIYPRMGQTSEQQASDEHECRQWAGDQMQVNSSSSDHSVINSADYQRALLTCLDGRGYTAK